MAYQLFHTKGGYLGDVFQPRYATVITVWWLCGSTSHFCGPLVYSMGAKYGLHQRCIWGL